MYQWFLFNFLYKEDRADNEIVTVTAKFWYVSDYSGRYREKEKYEKVDKHCVDDRKARKFCNRIVKDAVEEKLWWELFDENWLKDDSIQKRAQLTVNRSINYINVALANSEVPIRYIQWGSVQDIGKTEKEIGSGYTGLGGLVATRTADDVRNR